MLYHHIRYDAKPSVLDADKARIASFINGVKNDQCYELIDEEILKIPVEPEKIKVKIYVNQEKSLSLCKDTD